MSQADTILDCMKQMDKKDAEIAKMREVIDAVYILANEVDAVSWEETIQEIKEELKKVKCKGEKGGLCNRTACQSPHGVIWFNHSTRAYYCGGCAHMLNSDPFNARDAERMYGHELCTLIGE